MMIPALATTPDSAIRRIEACDGASTTPAHLRKADSAAGRSGAAAALRAARWPGTWSIVRVSLPVSSMTSLPRMAGRRRDRRKPAEVPSLLTTGQVVVVMHRRD
jgi:hypothetical protein